MSTLRCGITKVTKMRKTSLIGLVIVILASLAAGVLTAFAQSTPQPLSSSPDPRPGYTYYVVYRQSDGFIVSAVGCPPSPAVCAPTLQSGQSVMYITDQPVLVKQLFTDAYNSKLGNWHVNLQAHQLATTGTMSSASLAPAFGISLFGTLLPAFASLGVATSGSLIWRRARRRA
jgi:hypothetical protein